jgi:hypothetical protein
MAVTPSALARGLLMPLFADPNAAHKPLAEYLMQAPEHASLDAMVHVVSRLDGGYAAEHLRSALDEALVSYAASSHVKRLTPVAVAVRMRLVAPSSRWQR